MKIRNNVVKFLVVFSIVFSMVNMSETYAFWGGEIESAQTESLSNIMIGTWGETLYEEWTKGIVYQKGDIVYHEGAYYQANRRVKNHAPNSKKWSWVYWTEITL